MSLRFKRCAVPEHYNTYRIIDGQREIGIIYQDKKDGIYTVCCPTLQAYESFCTIAACKEYVKDVYAYNYIDVEVNLYVEN